MHSDLKKAAAGLKGLFQPQGIAIVGASADPAKPGGKVVQLLKEYGYPGAIFPVNPGRKEVQGLAAYASLAGIEPAVDLVVVAVEAAGVPAVVRECAELRLKNLVVISGGFAERGGAGAVLQEELAELAARHNLTILGPNCIGFINTLQPAPVSFSLTVESGILRSGPAAFVAQSGGLGILAIFLADLEKQGFSYMISTGNEVNLDFAAVLNFLVHEPDVRVIGGYLEGAKDGERLRRSCRAAAGAGKPVLILKAGDSQEAAAAIRSHTGALAGSREAYRAFFRQEGVLEVETLTEMLSLFKAFAPGRLPRGNRAAVLSLSGGMGVLAADLCVAAGLELARFSPQTVRSLQQLIPTIATAGNPLDPTAAILARMADIRRVIEIILADAGVDLFIFTTAIWRASGPASARMMADLFQETEKPFFIIWPGCSSDSRDIIFERGIPFFSELKDGISAAAALWRYAMFQNKRAQEASPAALAPGIRQVSQVSQGDGDFDSPRGRRQRAGLLLQMPAARGRNLTEAEAKQILAGWGINVPRGKAVRTLDQAAAAAGDIGYPVVLKVISPDMVHKTEAGAIKLALHNAAALREAWDELHHNLAARAPGIAPAGCLVEEMLPVHLEMMAGVKDDPVFGPLLLLGFGGIQVELLRDLAMRPAPLEPGQVEEMLGELKSAPLLGGFRGSAPVEITSLVEAVSRFSYLAAALKGSYSEMEINPLVICADGRVAAADALFLL